MATKAIAVSAVNPTILSIKDGAYKQAQAGDRIRDVAKFVIEQVPSFPDALPDEVKDQLYEGYRLRFNENNPIVEYAVVGGQYLPIGVNSELESAKEKVKIGVDYAYSYSQQQFGRLKNENPALHAILKDWRDRVGKYCHNRLADLKRQARTIKNEGVQRERGATSDFAQRITDVFEDLRVKCLNANKRGDETADSKKFSQAKIAFMTVWNK